MHILTAEDFIKSFCRIIDRPLISLQYSLALRLKMITLVSNHFLSESIIVCELDKSLYMHSRYILHILYEHIILY